MAEKKTETEKNNHRNEDAQALGSASRRRSGRRSGTTMNATIRGAGGGDRTGRDRTPDSRLAFLEEFEQATKQEGLSGTHFSSKHDKASMRSYSVIECRHSLIVPGRRKRKDGSGLMSNGLRFRL